MTSLVFILTEEMKWTLALNFQVQPAKLHLPNIVYKAGGILFNVRRDGRKLGGNTAWQVS